MEKSYEDKLQEQIEQYRETEQMHDLPEVFHLWSENYVRPGLRAVFDADDRNSFYAEAFIASAKYNTDEPYFLSLGCGDGAIEIGIARTLRDRGIRNFHFICYDLSEILLSRFRNKMSSDLAEHFDLVAGDLNAQKFSRPFDAIMAHHSLHHMVDLEGIFRTVYENLTDHGIFVTNDMIGRNGHMRWPEARLLLEFFWPFLTLRQRRNIQLKRLEDQFTDHDCSGEGFEGIRAQDILPLIIKQGFNASKFLGFGGMIDVVVDRCFGHNFNVEMEDDAFLIQRMAFLNEFFLNSGLIKPTMMFAYFVKYPVDEVCYRGRTVRSAVRDTARDPAWLSVALEDFSRHPTAPDFVFRSPASSAIRAGASDNLEITAVAELVAALRHAQRGTLDAQSEIARQAQRIKDMENSSSWLLTAPLRKLVRMVRR